MDDSWTRGPVVIVGRERTRRWRTAASPRRSPARGAPDRPRRRPDCSRPRRRHAHPPRGIDSAASAEHVREGQRGKRARHGSVLAGLVGAPAGVPLVPRRRPRVVEHVPAYQGRGRSSARWDGRPDHDPPLRAHHRSTVGPGADRDVVPLAGRPRRRGARHRPSALDARAARRRRRDGACTPRSTRRRPVGHLRPRGPRRHHRRRARRPGERSRGPQASSPRSRGARDRGAAAVTARRDRRDHGRRLRARRRTDRVRVRYHPPRARHPVAPRRRTDRPHEQRRHHRHRARTSTADAN